MRDDAVDVLGIIIQSTVTLSSCEAELNGVCKGASISLGLQSVAKDLGFHWDVALESDATAAIGVCRRRGLGKIRHLAVADLWVQDRLRRGDFTLSKIPGTENTSDTLTTIVDRSTLEKHLDTLGLCSATSRADLAPGINP